MPDLRPLVGVFHGLVDDVGQRPGFLAMRTALIGDQGGDIDLLAMPEALVTVCRAAWAAVAEAETQVVHGDLNPANLLWDAAGRVVLLDWDECRVDIALVDLAATGAVVSEAERCALDAWEIACCWGIEPERAITLARRVFPGLDFAGLS